MYVLVDVTALMIEYVEWLKGVYVLYLLLMKKFMFVFSVIVLQYFF